MKSLEDTIRDLAKKNKNKPSVLSEHYQHANSNVNFVSMVSKQQDSRDILLNSFKPNPTGFR